MGAVSAQKALQGSETETKLGGTEEKSTYFTDKGSFICPPVKSIILFTKMETGKIGLVDRPVVNPQDFGQDDLPGGNVDSRGVITHGLL